MASLGSWTAASCDLVPVRMSHHFAHDLAAAALDERPDRTVENLIIALAFRYDKDERGRPCFCKTVDAVEADGTVVHTPRCQSARIALDRWRSA